MTYKFDQPVKGTTGTENYRCSITWRNGNFISDEPVTTGGKDSGPDPFSLLLSSVISCKLITMRMYADHKGWDIPEMSVDANLFQEKNEIKVVTTIDCTFTFPGTTDEGQKARLMEIAKHCPVSRLLENEVIVRTFKQEPV